MHFDRIDHDSGELEAGTLTAAKVLLAAGSIGSAELLLRCRDEYRTLPAYRHGLDMDGRTMATS